MKIRNIVQSQITDFWFFRIIYYLPLFFIYTNTEKIKDLKETLSEESHLVSQNQFSRTDSRIPKIANADATCLWIAKVCRAEYDTAPKLSVETWNVSTTYVPKNDNFPCLSQSPLFSRNRKQILGRFDTGQSWQNFLNGSGILGFAGHVRSIICSFIFICFYNPLKCKKQT